MSRKLTAGILSASAAVAAAVLGFTLAAPAQAQPYGDQGAYIGDNGSEVGGLTVTAPRHRRERTFWGSEVVVARAHRVVDISDVDPSTAAGQDVILDRVQRAAADGCAELDRLWTVGLYPLQGNDADCYNFAVQRAMSRVEPTAYGGY
jgi:UrcA family protein